ncbi:hypothetical protein WJ84_01550 [Burkholderia ubonensis]|nr:hypothetical protein WJ84_01550 [Burkholderia ubonensis]
MATIGFNRARLVHGLARLVQRAAGVHDVLARRQQLREGKLGVTLGNRVNLQLLDHFLALFLFEGLEFLRSQNEAALAITNEHHVVDGAQHFVGQFFLDNETFALVSAPGRETFETRKRRWQVQVGLARCDRGLTGNRRTLHLRPKLSALLLELLQFLLQRRKTVGDRRRRLAGSCTPAAKNVSMRTGRQGHEERGNQQSHQAFARARVGAQSTLVKSEGFGHLLYPLV